MSNIEKIRQEIERRRDITGDLFEENSDTYYQGKAVAYNGLLSFIDSLPEEIPPFCTGFKGHPDPAGTSDLEEAANEYSERVSDGHNYRDLTCGFIAGAEWRKEQMMKDAVEAKVWESEHGFRDLEMESEPFRKALEGFKDGDKVKLIIVKEDDKGRND